MSQSRNQSQARTESSSNPGSRAASQQPFSRSGSQQPQSRSASMGPQSRSASMQREEPTGRRPRSRAPRSRSAGLDAGYESDQGARRRRRGRAQQGLPDGMPRIAEDRQVGQFNQQDVQQPQPGTQQPAQPEQQDEGSDDTLKVRSSISSPPSVDEWGAHHDCRSSASI